MGIQASSVMLLEVYDRKLFGVQIKVHFQTVKLQFENQRTWCIGSICVDNNVNPFSLLKKWQEDVINVSVQSFSHV